MSVALAVFAVAPQALGGLRLRARAGAAREAWLAELRAALPAERSWARLPAQADDEALHGGLDLAATLAAGRVLRSTGLLERARGGVLVAAMAERMPGGLAARLAAALDADNIALVALDEGADADEAPPESLLDRLGLQLELSPNERVLPHDTKTIAVARERWADVHVSEALIEALVAAAGAFGVTSARAAWFALVAARVSAALAGRDEATADDAQQAVRLVLAPRATQLPPSELSPPDMADAAQPPPPSPEGQSKNDNEATHEATSNAPLADRLIDAVRAALPAQLLAQLLAGGVRRGGASAGHSGATARSAQRGRPVGTQRGVPRGGARLALIDTLRNAAPWQRIRRQRLDAAPGRVIVLRDDLRVQRRVQRRGTTTIFAIDASGSQAMSRLAEAKGAVELLLADCYARRDQVAVIGFRGTGASILLAPTRSLVRAKRQLAGLPGGGGTPLAAGIDAARALAEKVERAGASPLLVLLTDGRANIDRRGEPGRAQAQDDALAAARTLAARGVGTLLIDTSAQPSPAARSQAHALAEALAARYLPLPHASAHAVSAAVRVQRGSAGPGRGGRP